METPKFVAKAIDICITVLVQPGTYTANFVQGIVGNFVKQLLRQTHIMEY